MKGLFLAAVVLCWPVMADDLGGTAFARLADESAAETDAELCKVATEAWAIKAFCHQKPKPLKVRWIRVATDAPWIHFPGGVKAQTVEIGLREDGQVIWR